jgi:hypothetical protein
MGQHLDAQTCQQHKRHRRVGFPESSAERLSEQIHFILRHSICTSPDTQTMLRAIRACAQAAVADRLRKQAKTRAVKEIREAVRECQYTISLDMLRGHHGALVCVSVCMSV